MRPVFTEKNRQEDPTESQVESKIKEQEKGQLTR
jgi:hypothetical protein